jgi:aldehyde:ferredoxin oxidoreductase
MAMKYLPNKIVNLDLTTSEISESSVPTDLTENYVGGTGINTKLLYDQVGPNTDELGEENILIFGAGVLVGSGFLASSRMTITAKSPLTGIFGDSNVGGKFGARMRSAGYDHIVVRGKATEPVYLLLASDSEPKICTASDLWGQDTEKSYALLKERHGKDSDIACIGPAGENLVRFASILVSRFRAAGRTGMGCVMGSKRLKAIVVKGPYGVNIADKSDFKRLRSEYLNLLKNSAVAASYSKYGTLQLVDHYNTAGWLPHRNGQHFQSDEAERRLKADVFNDKFQTGRSACYSCPIACSKKYRVAEGKFKGTKGTKIDYGSIATLGPNLGIMDYPAILDLHHAANSLGLDSMEAGMGISLIMEAVQRGELDHADTNNLTLEWGNHDVMKQLLYDIAYRRGIGDTLAEGVNRAGKSLGIERLSACVKGLACGPQPKNRNDWALGYAVSTRGGDHLKGFPFSTLYGAISTQFARKLFKNAAATRPKKPESSGRVIWWHENYKALIDSVGICIFAVSGLAIMGKPLHNELATLYSCVTGIPMTGSALRSAAERIVQLQKAFNVKHGITRKDDYLPLRHPENDIKKELIDNFTVDLDHTGMLDEYYQYRGYTREGLPTLQRLRQVGLESVAQELGDHIADESVYDLDELYEQMSLN